MQPLVFEPYLRPMVWGGRKLGSVLHKALPTEGSFGESWELSPHVHHVSRVAAGPLAGRTLSEICDEHPQEIFGRRQVHAGGFPLLIKLLDCEALLSIQVHPSDRLAGPLAGERFGKTEAWVILAAEPEAQVFAGLREGVTRDEVERRVSDGTLEQALHRFMPQPGDCVFLPAGTVHAVGGGVLMAEVQQASDATFRLYDWNRVGADGQPRQLHIRQALEAIDWNAGPVQPVTPEPLHRGTDLHEERLVVCPYFELDRVQFAATRSASLPASWQDGPTVWMVLAGAATLRTADGYERHFRAGETVLVPAAAAQPEWSAADQQAGAQLLRVGLPPAE